MCKINPCGCPIIVQPRILRAIFIMSGLLKQSSSKPDGTTPQFGGTQAVSYPFHCQVICNGWPCRSILTTLPTVTSSSNTTGPYADAFRMSREAYTPGPSMPEADGLNPSHSMRSA